MIRLYIIGIFILVIAIIANMIAIKLGLKTWYSFIELLTEDTLSAFKKITLLDGIWLFFAYPITLSLGYAIGKKVYETIF